MYKQIDNHGIQCVECALLQGHDDNNISKDTKLPYIV